MGGVGSGGAHNSRIYQHNVKVLDDIEASTLAAIDAVVEKRTDTMLRTLLHRRFMGNQGRFPKGDGTKAAQTGRATEPHAYTQWEKKKTGRARWSLTNDHVNRVDGYHYVRNLTSGKGWSDRVATGKHIRLRKGKGGLFSTQMPNGFAPWLRSQKKHMAKDILIQIQIGNNK